MPRSAIDRIRDKIRLQEYDITIHAMEEMAEDDLDTLDVEHGILNGQLARFEKDDRRGTKYVVEGFALDEETPVGIVGRFTGNGRYLIITIYEITDLDE